MSESDEQGLDITGEHSEKFKALLDKVLHVFCEKIPFHHLIGFRFDALDATSCKISFDMKPELVGNFVHGILHGGVTATALDMVGGALAAAAMLNKNHDMTEEEIAHKMSKVGTIDLRVDYVRPGKGESFYAIAKILRSGNKVAVLRMELHNQDDTLIALGTGTYMTG